MLDVTSLEMPVIHNGVQSAKVSTLRRIFIEDDLRTFMKLMDGKNFLNLEGPKSNSWMSTETSDISGTDIQCDTLVRISKPLLLMFMFGAVRCCKLALNSLSVEDLLRIREDAGNFLHALIIGCRAKLRPPKDYEAILTIILNTLTAEEVRQLNATSGHFGLRPVELAVRLDEFQLAERLLCNGVLPKVRNEVCGPQTIVTFDVSEYDYDMPDSRYLLSPIALLVENLSLDRIRAIKEAGILRPNSLFHVWATSYISSGLVLNQMMCLGFAVIMLSVIFKGNPVGDTVVSVTCGYSNSDAQTIHKYMDIFFVSFLLFACSVNLPMALFVIFKWASTLKKFKYPFSFVTVAVFPVALNYLIPAVVVICTMLASAVFLASPQSFCGTNDHIYIAISSTVFSISILYMSLYASQMIRISGHFLANFFDILSQFVRFLVFYFIIVLVFARIFQNIVILRLNHNNGTSAIAKHDVHLFNGFQETIYTTFRVSLNIVDFSRASTDTITMFVHLAFVLVLPFMFFNYIIGVVSAQLSAMVEVREERIYLHRTLLAIWGRIMFHPIDQLMNWCKKRKPQSLVTVCVPITDNCFCGKTRENILNDID